jgi:hypothetical protein
MVNNNESNLSIKDGSRSRFSQLNQNKEGN